MAVGLLLCWVTSAATRVYRIADDKTRRCLLIDGLLEQVHEAILLVDKASRAMRVNRESICMCGYLQKEIIGRTVVSFIVAEELCKEAECFADWIAQGQIVETVTTSAPPESDERNGSKSGRDGGN
jgi:transcriptional regulator with PAS, ATPase and Fis domain